GAPRGPDGADRRLADVAVVVSGRGRVVSLPGGRGSPAATRQSLSFRLTYFVSRYASSPSWPSSRPSPLSFIPPNGHCGVAGTGSFIPMIPASSPSAIRHITVKSFVNTYAARP